MWQMADTGGGDASLLGPGGSAKNITALDWGIMINYKSCVLCICRAMGLESTRWRSSFKKLYTPV